MFNDLGLLAFIFWVKLLSFSFQLLVFSSEYTGFFKCGHFIDFDAGAGYFIRDHAKYYPGKESGNYFCLRVVYGVNCSHGGCESGTFFDFI